MPEADRDDVREVIYQRSRILYWISETQRIDVLAIIHGSRDLSSTDQPPWEVQ